MVDISHEGLRVLLREEGVSFQRLKTWKTSRDPDLEVKKNRIQHNIRAVVTLELVGATRAAGSDWQMITTTRIQ